MSRPPKRNLEVFFCPGDMAIIRRAPPNKPARDSRDAIKVVGDDFFPDLAVYLMAKGRPIVEWAEKHLPAAAAHRVAEFVRTRRKSVLATLTEREMELLRAKNKELKNASQSLERTP